VNLARPFAAWPTLIITMKQAPEKKADKPTEAPAPAPAAKPTEPVTTPDPRTLVRGEVVDRVRIEHRKK